MIFPGLKEKLPKTSFQPFLKLRVMFHFFQSPGISPKRHNFSNMIESGYHISQFLLQALLTYTQSHQLASDLLYSYGGRGFAPPVPA